MIGVTAPGRVVLIVIVLATSVAVGLCQFAEQQSAAQLDQHRLANWAVGVREWLRKSPGDAGAHLARGVLLECLASPQHRDAFSWSLLSAEDSQACASPPAARGEDLPTGRLQVLYVTPELAMLGCQRAARQAYEKAVDRDKNLTEAALRLGSLTVRQPRSTPQKKDDVHLLHVLNSGGDSKLRFLASMFLGLAAERRSELAAAVTRYEQARVLGPEYPSVRYALASALHRQGQAPLARDLLNIHGPAAVDPPYNYSCEILTPEGSTRLRQWQAARGDVR